jgi:hypothetical protein
MGEEFRTQREEQSFRNFHSKNMKERFHFANLDLDVEISFTIKINIL